jgi:hypothetical protein
MSTPMLTVLGFLLLFGPAPAFSAAAGPQHVMSLSM